MVSCPEGTFPTIGKLVRFKGGTKVFEFRGQDREGKIVLKDAATGVNYLVGMDEVDCEPIMKIPEPIRP